MGPSSTNQMNPPCGNSAGEVPHFYDHASVISQTRLHGGPGGSLLFYLNCLNGRGATDVSQ